MQSTPTFSNKMMQIRQWCSRTPWKDPTYPQGYAYPRLKTPALVHYYPIPRKGMGSCSSLVSCTLLLSHPPEGDGILFFPGFMYTIIIIIPSPRRGWDLVLPGFMYTIIIIPSPRRGWDLVLPWFHVHYYYYYPIPQKGMGSCSSLVSCTLLLSHPP